MKAGRASLLLLLCLVSTSFAAVSHVVQMSIDGLGAVYLQEYLETDPEGFPNFRRLIAEGASTFNARTDFGATETIPNHTSMFTGRPAYQPPGLPNTTHHGQLNNSPPDSATYHNTGNPNVPYMPSVFDVVHDHGLSTAFFGGKTKLRIVERSYNVTNGRPDTIGEDNGRAKLDHVLINDYASYYGTPYTVEIDAFIDYLEDPVPKNFYFIHIAEPDITGHFVFPGHGGVAYSNMLRSIDVQLGRILNAIDSHPVLSNRTIFLLTTDHGGIGQGHSDPIWPESYTISFFLRGPGIPSNANLYSLFSNRVDPGTNRVNEVEPGQPVRNGDSGNIVCAMFGLPPIPGSLFQPAFSPLLVPLRLEITNDGSRLTWSALANNLVLQHTASLDQPWMDVAGTIETVDNTRMFAAGSLGVSGFYRLKSPQEINPD